MVCEERIRRQFEISEEEIASQALDDSDPLCEKEHEVVPGMINKYGNRVLCLLTSECAAYCRFCTRRRLVSDPAQGRVERLHVDAWVEYLSDHPEVRDVIISGGDPFIVEDDLFAYVLDQMSGIDSIKVIRIGTRAPVSDPSLVNCGKLDAIRRVDKPIYVGIHFEHPADYRRTGAVRHDLIAAGAILIRRPSSQGANDDYDNVYDPSPDRAYRLGCGHDYIYRCDPVPGAAFPG